MTNQLIKITNASFESKKGVSYDYKLINLSDSELHELKQNSYTVPCECMNVYGEYNHDGKLLKGYVPCEYIEFYHSDLNSLIEMLPNYVSDLLEFDTEE